MLVNQAVIKSVHSAIVFKELSAHEIKEIISIGTEVTLEKGEYCITEGEKNRSFFIIFEGKVEILKNGPKASQYILSIAKTGESIGEFSIFEDNQRSASARASKHTKLLAIKFDDLKKLMYEQPVLYAKVISNLARETSKRLRAINQDFTKSCNEAIENAQTQLAMGRFLISIIMLMCVYSFIIKIFAPLVSENSTNAVISISVALVFAIFTIAIVKFNHYPFDMYGLTIRNWKKSIVESTLYTIPFLLTILFIKWIVIHTVPIYANEPLFHTIFAYDKEHSHINSQERWLLIFIYSLFVPIQEFIVRGILQSSLQIFFTGRYRYLWAIVTSNLIFSTAHLYLSTILTVLVFVPGLFWGWLFARHKTLLGVTLSHWMFGMWVIYIVGIKAFTQ